MNAPWRTAGPGKREPFAAFVCDDATRAILRPVVTDLGWEADRCHDGGLRGAIQMLSVSASPSILMVDLSESGEPLDDIGALAEVCEPGTLVIALGQVNDVRLYRDLLGSGIHDYLLKPLSAGQARDALTTAEAVFNAPRPDDSQPEHRHVATAVIGTRGGVGASTVATSLAWLFSTEHRRRTALLDLDVHFGTAALALDLEPGRGLTDAIDNPGRIDGLFIERAMIRASEQLAILSAEAPLNAPLSTDGTAFVRLEEEFRQAFEMSVIDLPRPMLINFPHLVGAAGVVVLTTELTLASARDAIRILSWLKGQAPQARTIVVANKVQPGAGEIARPDFESSIERKLDILVPYDAKGAAQAAKIGQTLAQAQVAAKPAQALRDLAREVIESGADDGAALPGIRARKSLLGRFGELRLLKTPRSRKALAGR